MSSGVRVYRTWVVCAYAIVALAGCGGGGHGVIPGSGGGGGRAPDQAMTVKIGIPVASHASAERKHPAFVVSATNGLEIAAVDGSSVQVGHQIYDVSASSPDCTTNAGLRTCTLAFDLPIGGPYTITITSYDQAPSGGVIPVAANQLARGIAPNVTVTGGVTNAISATLDGTAASVAFPAGLHATLAATVQSFAVPLGIADASGTAIVGALSAPLTVGVTDTGGHVTLSIDGGTTKAASVQIQSSTDAAALEAYYDGAAGAGYSATITASGVPTSADTFVSVLGVTATAGFGTPHFSGGSADFTAPSQQLVLSPTEPHFAGSITEGTNTCGGFVTVAPSGADFTATSVLPTASCHVDFTDGSLTVSVPVSVTTTGASVGVPSARGTVNVTGTLAGSMIPDEIVAGPDGALWFVADDGTDSEFGRAGVDGTFAEFPIATPGTVRTVGVGPDGRVWSGDYGSGTLYAIDTSTHVVTTYDVSATVGGIAGIVAGPDGNLWITDDVNCVVDSIDTSGHIVSSTPITFASVLSDITVGPDGDLWFGDQASGKLGRIDPATHVETPFPTDALPVTGVGRITTGADGALWFTAVYGGGLGRMTTSGAFTFYPTVASAPAFGVVSAPDNTLWFTGCGCGSALDTLTTGGSESAISVGANEPFDLAVGSDAAVWFIDPNARTVGRIQP